MGSRIRENAPRPSEFHLLARTTLGNIRVKRLLSCPLRFLQLRNHVSNCGYIGGEGTRRLYPSHIIIRHRCAEIPSGGTNRKNLRFYIAPIATRSALWIRGASATCISYSILNKSCSTQTPIDSSPMLLPKGCQWLQLFAAVRLWRLSSREKKARRKYEEPATKRKHGVADATQQISTSSDDKHCAWNTMALEHAKIAKMHGRELRCAPYISKSAPRINLALTENLRRFPKIDQKFALEHFRRA
jgi:hypothetical protein